MEKRAALARGLLPALYRPEVVAHARRHFWPEDAKRRTLTSITVRTEIHAGRRPKNRSFSVILPAQNVAAQERVGSIGASVDDFFSSQGAGD
jgi:hypothetical protein